MKVRSKGLIVLIASCLCIALAQPSFGAAYPPAPGTLLPVLVPPTTVKVTAPNQVAPPAQSVSLSAPDGANLSSIIINGKVYKTTSTDLSKIKMPVLVGPKDKVIIEVVDSNGNIVNVPVVPQTSNVVLGNINFDSGLTGLSGAAKKSLDALAKSVLLHGFTTIDLVGFTDGPGTVNQQLAQTRAAAVATYLRSKLGNAKVKVIVAAKAVVTSAASNATAAGRALNRRVQVSVH